LIDTGNEGISISDDAVAQALAAATGGGWVHGALVVDTTPTLPIVVETGSIRVSIPASVWVGVFLVLTLAFGSLEV
jgi:hypothetical protein